MAPLQHETNGVHDLDNGRKATITLVAQHDEHDHRDIWNISITNEAALPKDVMSWLRLGVLTIHLDGKPGHEMTYTGWDWSTEIGPHAEFVESDGCPTELLQDVLDCFADVYDS